MARDQQVHGCWCGIDGNFNMEFMAPSTIQQSRKRKRGSVDPFEFLYTTATHRSTLGLKGRYSTARTPEFTPLNQKLSVDSFPLSMDHHEPVHKKVKISTGYPMPIDHLDGTTTVIIGGGIIGLLITLELATKADFTGTDLRIVVLDINEDVCQLVSQQCAGLLSLDGTDERWAPLGLDFLSRWQDIESSVGV